MFVFVTFGVGFASVNTGNNLMYLVLGFMLSLIVLSGILSEAVLRQLTVKRRLPTRAFAGEPALVEISVENHKKRMVSYSVEVEDQADNAPNERRCYFLKVLPGEEQTSAYRRKVEQRGKLQLSHLRVSTRFPFSMFQKWRRVEQEEELVVFPRLLPTAMPEGPPRDEGERRGNAPGRGTETRELRDYRINDEVRAIHWRRTAALGRPVVRELEREAASRLSLAIDNARPEGDDEWDTLFEETISRAAFIVERALSQGLSVEVRVRGERSPALSTGTPPDAIWRFLALLQPVPEKGAPPMAAPGDSARAVDLSVGDAERAA